MKTTDKKKTADVLTERSLWVRVGMLPIRIRPLTLGQIYEIGPHACQLEAEGLDMKARIIASAEMFARYASARQMQEIFLICAFRKRWMRKVLRRYIINRLTVRMFQRAVTVMTNAFSANFFLTSIISLHQMNQVTEPKITTPLGQSSEE